MDWKIQSTWVGLWLALILSSVDMASAEQRVVCYYTNWSVYRPGTAKFSPQNINPYLCTHLIYAFGGFTKDNTLKPFDKYQDIEKGGYAKFTGLKTYNKNLKTMLAIGGWNEGSTRFSPMVADPDRRQEFVKNAVKFLRQNHFDGLDLDWEYPAFRDGGKSRDRNNYADLVQELREEFERESSKTGRSRLLLSMAIPAGIEYLEKGYDLSRLNEYLDFFNLLSYDYHSAFEPAVNHHAPLYGLEEDNEYNYDSELTIDHTISYLIKHDVSPEKIVLGIPTYGRSYTLFNTAATEIGSPADGPGEEGDATREKGYLAYYEICENIGKSNEWEVIQPNPKAMGPYAFKDNQWVGYDDEDIVRVKAQYVNEKGLGGIMFWSIDNDDFRGKCHDRPYPLIEAAKEAMLTGNDKTRPTHKLKSTGNSKKNRPQNNTQRSQENLPGRRFRTEENKRRSSTPKPSNKRRPSTNSERFNARSQSRGNVDEDDNEKERNALRETTNESRSRSRPRTRANRVGARKKPQRGQVEDQLSDDSVKESSSSQLTTPEPPTTPDPGTDFKCEDEGFFSHPRDCKKYFWCLDSGPGGLGIVGHQFTCPSGLVFNKAADSCDYPRNVVCPKAKTQKTTTKAPTTTTTVRSTTRKTTPKPTQVEDYEYYDEDENSAEDDVEEEIAERSTTTAKSLIYKSINRARPTTTTTTTTEFPTTTSSGSFRPIKDKLLDFDEEEDPRVIKELIDLIKKAGGIEQLEKQLNFQEKPTISRVDSIKGEEEITPASISRSLYERVLNRQTTRVLNRFEGSTTQSTLRSSTFTTAPTRKTNFRYQNGPGAAQFAGLDDIPEVQSLRRVNKPQYVTIERQRISTESTLSDENAEDEMADQEELEDDSEDVASSENRAVNNRPEDEQSISPKKATPSYVNIRRPRPTTPAEDNLNDMPGVLSTSTMVHDEEIPKHEESGQDSIQNKFRYTNVQRFRSTTTRSNESTISMDNDEFIKDPSTELSDSTTPLNVWNTSVSERPIISSTEFFSSPTTTQFTGESTIISDITIENRSTTLNTSPQSIYDSAVTLNENFVTESPLTTLPIPSSTKNNQPPISRTTAVAQPRPFGFPRRGRPTTSTTPQTTVISITEQNKAKINLFRSPGIFRRKPGSISRAETHDRLSVTSKTPIVGGTNSETRYSSKIKAEVNDLSSRAQEITVSVADPPTATSSIETGVENTSRFRGVQRHIRIDTKPHAITESPTNQRTTISSARRRQRPVNDARVAVAVISHRPRQPAIIDYDYYVDEEVRLSIRPELKDKIYITRGGGIGCLDQGNFAHPTSCKKFITCARMVSGQVIATEYTCPDKLSFDPVGGICNWSAGLGCKEKSFNL